MPQQDPWIDIRLVFRNGRIWWSTRPSGYRGFTPIKSSTNRWISIDDCMIPAMLKEWLQQTVDSLGDEVGLHKSGPLTLPVFVNPWDSSLLDKGLHPGSLLRRVEKTITGACAIDPEKLSVVLATIKTSRHRRAVSLPYRVLATSDISDQTFSQIRNAGWYDNVVQDYGLTLDTVDIGGTRGHNCEILICGEGAFSEILKDPKPGYRISARLYVVLKETGGPLEWAERSEEVMPLASASTLWVDASFALGNKFILSFLEGIIHDHPLHQALRAALRATHGPIVRPISEQSVLLRSDRIANQNLRIRDTALRMYEQALDMYEHFDIGPVDDVLQSDTYLSDPIVEQAMLDAREAGSQLLGEIQNHTLMYADFTQEIVGLQPRAEALRSMSDARTLGLKANQLIGEAMTAPVREQMVKLQERRVNLKLLRLTPAPGDSFIIAKGESLARGQPYRLRVNIGRFSADNLVVGESPPIDTLLPEPTRVEGHLLSIVLQPLEFKALGRTLKKLTLPTVGPSESVSFDIRAPNETGQARVRVLVYLEHAPEDTKKQAPRNHLVQSLLLETRVTEESEWNGEDITTAKVEFSRSHRLANLDALGERALSIALNLDPDGANHTLAVKIGDEHSDLDITEAQMNKGLGDFREILRHAAFQDPENLSGAKFLEGENETVKESDFDNTVRKLAGLGRNLWSSLIQTKLRRNKKLRNLVNDLESRSDQKIQVVPLRSTLFPWSSLYDSPLGDGASEVCRGYRRVDNNGDPYSCAQCLQQCLHPDRSQVVCIYGFWGARFPIEQLMTGATLDDVTEVRPVQGRALHLSIGLEHGPASQLPAELGGSLGSQRILEYQAADPVLDLLWHSADRPAIVLLVGHSEIFSDPQLGIEYPRITLPGNGRWLSPRDLGNKLQNSGNQFLEDPSPIVILAACDSATINLSSFMEFIQQFDSVGAAAVVGTETPVVEQFAAAFGKRLTSHLFEAKSLSEALLAIRREGILEDNPLGFAVTAFGDATLEISP